MCHGVVVITTALQSTKPELRFCIVSKPALQQSGSLTMVTAGNKAKHLLLVNHTIRTIQHYHHHHYHHQFPITLLQTWSLCPLFFIKFLFFTKWQLFQNYEKCFLFHLKSSFPSRDIQIFVFLFFTLFLPVSHCFRGWSKINLKIYDVIIV